MERLTTTADYLYRNGLGPKPQPVKTYTDVIPIEHVTVIVPVYERGDLP